ncbi:MAG: QcrA and Rieske domain-containing protein [Thermoleophilia bacterium]
MKLSEIPAGQGASGEIGGRPVAVYHAEDGPVVLENICTHLGCQTAFNADGPSWDCPCHGSRYNPDGSVLQGPAAAPLPALDFRIVADEILLGSEG